jgi:cytoskeletal protein CcmA (bactofilin family)
MDPSKLQSESGNDVNSLEGTGTIVEDEKSPNTSAGPGGDKADVSDATGGSSGGDSNSSAKPPLLKRIWQKFNIYLLLFALVVIIAIVITAVLFLKNRSEVNDSKDIIDTQSLSEESLKQLSNSNVTVGNSKQILNIESNAIFAGAVLVRSNLEVAGSIKVGGELQLPGITVSGASRFSELQADNITIGASASIQGTLTVKNGMNVTGKSVFNGPLSAPVISTNSLELNGDLILTHHITAGGPIPGLTKGAALGSGGTASVSGSDTAGSITINTGGGPGAGCFATISFVRKFNGVPHVNVTPIGSAAAGLNYYVNRSTTEFSVCTTSPAASGQSFGFDYIVLD